MATAIITAGSSGRAVATDVVAEGADAPSAARA